MPRYIPGVITQRTAAVDLSSRQYHFVKPSTVYPNIDLCVDSTNPIFGILLNRPTVSLPANVAITGTALLHVAESSVGPNTKLTANTVGRGVIAAANQTWMATLVEPVTAVDSIVEVLLISGSQVVVV
jgi:hypothetical protein